MKNQSKIKHISNHKIQKVGSTLECANDTQLTAKKVEVIKADKSFHAMLRDLAPVIAINSKRKQANGFSFRPRPR